MAGLVAADDGTFDPAGIPKALRKAGFKAGDIQITTAGKLSKEGDLLALEMTGTVKKFVLAGGKAIESVSNRPELIGTRIRVTGKLHPSHAEKPPGITVERWERVSSQ